MGTLICTKCSTENPADKKFCGECGAHLASGCPACGATNLPGQKYCGDCGTALPARPVSVPVSGSSASGSAPVAERRLVIVLFADLVGFTPFAEERDAEEVREHPDPLLRDRLATSSSATAARSRSSSATRSWPSGARPTAHEDDAERAVRAGARARRRRPGAWARRSQARAGVLTGEAAVTARRDEPGHGRRRPRQHRRPPAVGGAAGQPSSSARRPTRAASRRSPSRRPATRC